MPQYQQDLPNSELKQNLPLSESLEGWPEPEAAFDHRTGSLLDLLALSQSRLKSQSYQSDQELAGQSPQKKTGNSGL